MSQSEGTQTWRAPLVFCLGLIAAAIAVVGLDASARKFALAHPIERFLLDKDMPIPLMPPRPLSAQDRAAAEIAWGYIEANTQSGTGLINSVNGYTATTLWDQGSYLFGLVSARRLKLIEDGEYHERVSAFLNSLGQLPLFDGQLPNKAYNTVSLEMVDYANAPSPRGIGWSAIDIGRILMALRVLEYASPSYGPTIRGILAKWQLEEMASFGDMIGTEVQSGETIARQEGRVGYEQYAARTAALWGADVQLAMSASGRMNWSQVDGIRVPVDVRDHRTFEAITPTLSEPYILMALELGLNNESHVLASQVYRAQEARYRNEGELTMVSEDHVSQSPYFLYASVFGNGAEWPVLSEDGKRYDDLRTVSLKAAYAWDAMFDTQYTNLVVEELQPLASDTLGWAAGRYERDGSTNAVYTLNTNAVVLEALHFKAFGPMWAPLLGAIDAENSVEPLNKSE